MNEINQKTISNDLSGENAGMPVLSEEIFETRRKAIKLFDAAIVRITSNEGEPIIINIKNTGISPAGSLGLLSVALGRKHS